MIGDLIDRVQKTQLAEKDTDAEQMLQEGLGKKPDALYILAQTVLVQKYALEQSQAQFAQAKAQIEQMQQHPEPKHATSFLGNLLGRNDSPTPPPPPPSAQGWTQVPPQYVAAGYPQQYAPVGYGAPMGMGGGGGFLRGAMQTAAGVAAGALAFEGIESLMHGFGSSAGYGPGLGGFGGGERPEVINNYYGDDRGERGGEHGVSGDERASGNQMDRDTAGGLDSKNERDSLYGASGDSGSGIEDRGSEDRGSRFDGVGSQPEDGGSNLDDSGSDFEAGGSDFDDSGAGFDDGGGGFDNGGGDDSNF